MFSKSLQSSVAFANFAIQHGIKPYDLAELITLANHASNAQTRYANTGLEKHDRSASREMHRFAEKAKAAGFDTTWYGLWPTLSKDRTEYTLPTD